LIELRFFSNSSKEQVSRRRIEEGERGKWLKEKCLSNITLLILTPLSSLKTSVLLTSRIMCEWWFRWRKLHINSFNEIFLTFWINNIRVRCNTCGNYLYIGTKFNMRKETVLNESYLGIRIYRFYLKCTHCYTEVTFKTDPKNHDYVLEFGGTQRIWTNHLLICISILFQSHP